MTLLTGVRGDHHRVDSGKLGVQPFSVLVCGHRLDEKATLRSGMLARRVKPSFVDKE